MLVQHQNSSREQIFVSVKGNNSQKIAKIMCLLRVHVNSRITKVTSAFLNRYISKQLTQEDLECGQYVQL